MRSVPGITWSASESASVNEFLSSPVGKKWLGVLLTHKPQVDRSSMEKAALSGAFSAGYEHFFNEIAATRLTIEEDNASIKTIDMVRD
jgi:hypothetical protein